MNFQTLFFLLPLIGYSEGAASPQNDIVAIYNKYDMPDAFLESVKKVKRDEDYVAYQNVPMECHSSCGSAILAASACSGDSGYDSACLCDGTFADYVPYCLDCGWCLYSWYYPKLTNALEFCGDPTAPTGTICVTSSTSSTLGSVEDTESTSTAAENTQSADSTTSTQNTQAESSEASTSESSAESEDSTSSSVTSETEGNSSAADTTSDSTETGVTEESSSSSATLESTSSTPEVLQGMGSISFSSGSLLASLMIVFVGTVVFI